MTDKLLFIVPARRAVVRQRCTYDEAMRAWFAECNAHAETLRAWYGPIRRPEASPDRALVILSWTRALREVTRTWQRAVAENNATMVMECEASAGGDMVCQTFTPPRARLWKGPLRVLLEQEKYGVLGRTLRTRGDALDGRLHPPFSARMMEPTGSGGVVADDGIVTVECDGGPVRLRQNARGEVTVIDADFLPGDLLEFPLFTLLDLFAVQGMDGATFNGHGSPFLGTSVADRTGSSPGAVRLHDNMLAMRFQLHLNLTRGAFYSLRPVMNGALSPSEEAPSGGGLLPDDATDAQLQAEKRAEVLVDYLLRFPMREWVPILRRARPGGGALRRERVDLLADARAERRARNRRASDARRQQREAAAAATPEDAVAVARRAAQQRLRTDYHALTNKAQVQGQWIYARGLIYGGSLQNTPPDAFGPQNHILQREGPDLVLDSSHFLKDYEYIARSWGRSGLATRRAYDSIPGRADSQRLTSCWSCTPGTTAVTYFLLHALNPGGGNGDSVRSHHDARLSIFFSAREPSPTIVRFVRFHRYGSDASLQPTPGAIDELVGPARATSERFLRGLSFESLRQPLRRVVENLQNDGTHPPEVPLALPELREYFLGSYNAAFSALTLSGHELLLVWVWPHAMLLRERVHPDPLHDPPPFPAPERPPPPDPASQRAELAAAFGVTTGAASSEPTDASTDEEDGGDLGHEGTVAPRTSGGPADSRGHFDGAHERCQHTTAPKHGPPVAGFIAAYNPLDGTPFDTTEYGDLFGYEARGSLKRLTYYVDPLVSAGASSGRRRPAGYRHVDAFTGKPARFEPIQRAWVKVEGQTLVFDDLGQNQRKMRLMAFTHIDRDALRSLYRHPVAHEPITLPHSRNLTDAQTHAFTRARMGRNPSLPVPEDRASVVRAWYADRAVPFPTLLETRDDASYVERHTARSVTDNTITLLDKVAAAPRDLHFSARQVGIDPTVHKSAILQMLEFLKG